MRPTQRQIIGRWRREIVQQAKKIDPGQEHDWHSIWVGFVIGAGRPEFADYQTYMAIGFPEEIADAYEDDKA